MNNGIIGIGQPHYWESAPMTIALSTATDVALPYGTPPHVCEVFIEMVTASAGYTFIGVRIPADSVFDNLANNPFFTPSWTPGNIHIATAGNNMTIRNFNAGGATALTLGDWRMRVNALWLEV